jgi:hypothetical protein
MLSLADYTAVVNLRGKIASWSAPRTCQANAIPALRFDFNKNRRNFIMENATIPATNLDNDRGHDGDPASKGKVDEAASYVGQKAEDATAYVGHKAEDAAAYMGHRAEDAADYAAQKSGESMSKAGAGLRSLGGSVRESGPESGIGHGATAAVADGLENTGRYLEEQGVKEMVEDLTNLIRRNPIPALLIGAGAGYLFGRAMTPRS